jgi:sterol desaturase/sphingolipid hydroxylase (fatty acid hydroxylase superfamily)
MLYDWFFPGNIVTATVIPASDFIRTLLRADISGHTISLVWQTAAALAILFAAVLGVEVLAGDRRTVRYVQAPFRTDLFYTFLIVGGIYGSIQQPLLTWIDSVLRHYASFLYLDALSNFPGPLRLFGFLVAVDFCRYWKHRWLHSVPFLQAFHSIHHAPDNLNILTTYRIHFCEYLFDGIVMLIPVVLLGIPPVMWLPLYLILILYSSVAHSDLDLSFGWLDRVFVSPRFHAVHHSADRCEYDANFGALFSFWDIIFDTANFLPSRPRQYGLPQLPMPHSFFGQLFFPATLILRRIRVKPIADASGRIVPDGVSAQTNSKEA